HDRRVGASLEFRDLVDRAADYEAVPHQELAERNDSAIDERRFDLCGSSHDRRSRCRSAKDRRGLVARTLWPASEGFDGDSDENRIGQRRDVRADGPIKGWELEARDCTPRC